LFSWLDEFIRKTWYEQHVSPPRPKPSRPRMQRIADREWVDRQKTADHEVDAKRGPTNRGVPAGNRSNASRLCRTDQAPPQSVKSIGRARRGQMDQAITFLRRELANGEVAATRLEEKAKANGISPRTLDRARARLNVTCRRTGFAKSGKSWLSLPTTP
jgi:hypothetical protein